MDTSNLTLAPPAAFKTPPAVGATDTAQPTKAAVPAPTHDRGLSPAPAAVAATAEQPPVKQAAEVTADEQVQSQNRVQDTLRKLNDLAQTSIAFSQHEETGRTVIRVSDKDTGEEIRTIPRKSSLGMVRISSPDSLSLTVITVRPVSSC